MPLRPEVLAAWPPQGWQFYQPQTNWHAPGPLENNFKQQVENIIKMRQSNPRHGLPSDYLTVASELERYTEKRLKSHPKFCIGKDAVMAQKKSTVSSSNRLLQVAGAVVGAGLNVDPRALVEWLGSGKRPVATDVSERRGQICFSCPANSESEACPEPHRKSWQDWFTAPFAKAIRSYYSWRDRLQLKTSSDSRLGKCLACHCELQLKVHVPLEHIRANMEPDVVEELKKYPHCWVMTE